MHLRLCEWSSVDAAALTRAQRHALGEAVEEWRTMHRLPQPPLAFTGADGTMLCAAQYVGVVQASGVTVEVFPKLDSALVSAVQLPAERLSAVMSNLLWLLEESAHGNLIDAGSAPLVEVPDSFPDLLAWLLARRLRTQLLQGAPYDYQAEEDDLPLVRGRIDFPRQAGRLWMRPDRIACRWEEYSPDTPLARVLHCAASEMLQRVRLPGAAVELAAALALFADVMPIRAPEALSIAPQVRWTRQAERWHPCFDLSVALLSGMSREWRSGDAGSFVFLLDMNKVFEDFCAARLARWFGVRIQTQAQLGTLLREKSGGLRQTADFLWECGDTLWIGDAKYKRASSSGPPSAWLDPADVRQLICYGQLATLANPARPRRLLLLHPVTKAADVFQTYGFDGTRIAILPVPVVREAADAVSCVGALYP